MKKFGKIGIAVAGIIVLTIAAVISPRHGTPSTKQGKDGLGFMIFQLGESRSTTLANIPESKFELISNSDFVRAQYSGRLTFFMMEHPAFCVQTKIESAAEFGMVACNDPKNGVPSIILVYSNDILVSIVVRFNGGDLNDIQSKVKEKYGIAETPIDGGADHVFEQTLSYPGVFTMLKDLDDGCESCRATSLQQKSADDIVFAIRKDDSIVKIGLTNKQLLKNQLLAHEQMARREIATEKKKDAF